MPLKISIIIEVANEQSNAIKERNKKRHKKRKITRRQQNISYVPKKSTNKPYSPAASTVTSTWYFLFLEKEAAEEKT